MGVPLAAANSSGRTGRSGKQGVTCSQCHGGGTRPALEFIGASELGVGESATFTFRVKAGSALQRAAGFNVAAASGTLAVIAQQGARLSSGELTHSSPKNNDAGGFAAWQFSWTAPGEPGTYRLYGAGNSVNRNGQSSGDRSDTLTFDIVVVDGAHTPTPTPTATPIASTATATASASATTTSSATRTVTATRTPSAAATMLPSATAAATSTATATASQAAATSTASATAVPSGTAPSSATPSEPVPTATPSPSGEDTTTPTVTHTPVGCAGDCDRNQTVVVSELITAVNIALGTLPPDTCPSADRDGNGIVAIDELLSGVNNVLSGC